MCKKFGDFKKNSYLCSAKPAHERVGSKVILWNEACGQLYGQSRKAFSKRYLSVSSNLANLNLRNSGDANETSAQGGLDVPTS